MLYMASDIPSSVHIADSNDVSNELSRSIYTKAVYM